MKPGQSKVIPRLSSKSQSVVVVKLSPQPDRCQAVALLNADTVVLLRKARLQVLHRGQSFEGSLEPTA